VLPIFLLKRYHTATILITVPSAERRPKCAESTNCYNYLIENQKSEPEIDEVGDGGHDFTLTKSLAILKRYWIVHSSSVRR
jgi:hypothetical protein